MKKILFLIVFILDFILITPMVYGQTFRIQGLIGSKSTGNSCDGTLCPTQLLATLDSNQPVIISSPYTFDNLTNTPHTITLSADGYKFYYSVCYNCVDHPADSYVEGNTVNLTPVAGGYVDIWWQLWKIVPGLTCFYPIHGIPPSTHEIIKNGDPVSVNLGFTSIFGGIGTKFELINNNDPSSRFNIIEARSAAGAAWQFTGMSSEALINQAAGNSPGFQWGYFTDLELINNSASSELYSNNWVSNPTDTENNEGANPCGIFNNPSSVKDEGKPYVVVKTVPVSQGKIIDIVSEYTLRSLEKQILGYYSGNQALYLNRQVARDHDLRIYLIGQGWIEGPIRIYEDFTVSHAEFFDPGGNNNWTLWNILSKFNPKRLLFVYSVNGLDIGILLKDISKGVTLRMTKTVYCLDPNNYSCGSIDAIVTERTDSNIVYPIGSVRTYAFEYAVGTVPQLEEYIGEALLPCRIQGLKMAPNESDMIEPLRSQKITCAGVSQTSEPFVFYGMNGGLQTCSISVPSGYDVFYNVCYDLNNPLCHKDAYIQGSSASIQCPSGGYADLWWRYSLLCSSCNLPELSHSLGNGNCDRKINALDFGLWKKIHTSGGIISETDKAKVDFNCQSTDIKHTVDLLDFQIWTENYQ